MGLTYLRAPIPGHQPRQRSIDVVSQGGLGANVSVSGFLQISSMKPELEQAGSKVDAFETGLAAPDSVPDKLLTLAGKLGG